jgi:hypothetical protein
VSTHPGVNSQRAGDFDEQSGDPLPEQPLVHVQPSWSRHSKSYRSAEQASAVPEQLLVDTDQSQPCCRTQLLRSVSDEQPNAVPEQLLVSPHPSTVLHCALVSIAHGVGTPEQDARPEPGPVRSHQPESPQRVRAGQSLSSEQVATQIPAPMHIVCAPKVLQSSVLAQSSVH